MASLAEYRRLRSAATARRIGDGGPDTAAALTAALDEAVAALGEAAGDGEAVVAVGGYGRGELCLWSDVDILLLHHGGDPSRLVRSVLYPLWDANLKVGHAVRTVGECVAAARDRFETLTSLLSARLVSGDAAVMADLQAAITGVVEGKPLTRTLTARERERRLRQPYPLMAADVKNGRGGLRTFQGFWLERRRAVLLDIEEEAETPAERRARDDLLAIRNGLHAASGRAMDVFDFDLREPVARWLGTDPMTAARRLCRALAEGDRLAAQRWPDLLVDDATHGGLRRRRRRRATVAVDAPLPRVAAIAAGSGPMTLDGETRRLLADPGPRPWTAEDRAALVSLLAGGERERTAFAWLEETGWVARRLPEWAEVSSRPEPAPFHEHPVDAHLWRTAAEMGRIIRSTDPLTASIVADVGPTEPLLLAAFLHDIGKGGGSDHSVAGAEAAAHLLRRAGFAPSIQADVVAAVSRHLLLARTATRSDIADPEVLDEVADAVGSLRSLQILYLLTIADARATGRTMWTDWKAVLLRDLFVRVAARLSSERTADAAVDPESVAAAASGAATAGEVAEHLAAMPAEYSMSLNEADVGWHLEAISAMGGGVAILPDDAGRRVVIAGVDRRGFLLAVCRAFAASGVAVLDARLNTRVDGIVVDVFEVRDDRTGDRVEPARWAPIAESVTAILDGERDVRRAVAERSNAYPMSSRAGVRVRALSADAHRHTVIEVRAPDRIGLLADIAEALHGEGLDVRLARIDTRAGEAIDTFHVRRLGVPIRTGPELSALVGRLQDRLDG